MMDDKPAMVVRLPLNRNTDPAVKMLFNPAPFLNSCLTESSSLSQRSVVMMHSMFSRTPRIIRPMPMPMIM